MYAVILKESDKYVNLDANLKGPWESDEASLVVYLLYLDLMAKRGAVANDETRRLLVAESQHYGLEKQKVNDLFRFFVSERLPTFGNFDPKTLIGKLVFADEGILTPPTPIIEVTRFCNYKCRWCYIPHRDESRAEYDETQLADNVIVPLLENYGLLEWCLTGGEPSVAKQRSLAIANLITDCSQAILNKRPQSIHMLTNGYNLAQNIDEYYGAGINRFQVALTSPVEETEVNLRQSPQGINSYQHAVEGLKKAKTIGAKTEINMVLQPPSQAYRTNLYDLEGMFDLAKSLRVDMLRVIPAVPTGKALTNNVFFSSKDYQYIGESVSQLRKAYEADFIVDCPVDRKIEKNREIFCRAGTLWIYLNYCGQVYPCSNMQVNALRCDKATIKEESLSRIWMTSPILETMRDYNRKTISDECMACAKRAECVGECRALCWSRYNTIDLNEKPERCYAHYAE